MQSRRFAHIALPLPVDHPFTYEVPPRFRKHIALGMRVFVPVQNRTETGYVVGLSAETDVAKVKPIRDLPDGEPILTEEMLGLCKWLAEYYCCSWGEALQCALPAGIRKRSTMQYTLVADQLTPGRYSERQQQIVAALYRCGSLTETQLVKELGNARIRSTLQTLVARGVLLAEPVVRDTGASIRTETYVRVQEDAVPDNNGLIALLRQAPKQAAVFLDLLHGQGERAATELYARHAVTSGTLAGLADKGLIERFERELYRAPAFTEDERSRTKLTLNADQQTTYNAIKASLDRQEFETFLLKGITGSGKTEVYLQAIEYALGLGRDAILLVPEISLTPQTVGRLMGRFGKEIAVLHSGLGRGERYDEWRRAQRGEVRIVVGARSAVFAPVRSLGLIVVDEEHDSSYKQGESPRYHGRDVAIMRAMMNKAACVLGSATPSIESFANTERGKSTCLELRSRATSGSLPEVEVVDMRPVAKEHGGETLFSPTLEAAIQERLDAKEQVLLLLNRRGFAPFVLCPECGWVARCEDCNVSLTYHAKGGFVSCHYCAARRDVPSACEECGFRRLLFLGVGTQRIEDLLIRTYPGARVARMDADTTSGKGGHGKILGRFASGEIDILIGTQMIAKGHDFPGITLVGVINADTGLSVPDFRAAENTFQLLTQVAGRAGRGAKPGTVIIQTYRPNHYAIRAASQHDYDAFYRREIEERAAAGYPPHRRMAMLAVESEEPVLAERAAAVLHRAVNEAIAELGFRGLEVVGPAPAMISRVKRKYRWNLAVFSRSTKRLNAVARSARDGFQGAVSSDKVALKVDLDPYGMY